MAQTLDVRRPVLTDPRVVPLAPGLATAEVGGKAAGLARLIALGAPVPAGFVVTADAYGAHLARVRSNDPAAVAAALRAVPVDPTLVEAIAGALAALGGGAVAVRSSGAAEDGAARSFAGQHLTRLDVVGLDAVVDAVRACWASAWAPGAAAYRGALGAGGRPAPMAVLVQRMVAADAAGVLFTCDPGGGAGVVVEAVAGLGAPLVDGRASPDRYRVDRATGAVTVEARGAGAPLGAAPLATLVSLAGRVEAAFGGPQDVEWAVEGGAAWLLQARPITTLPAAGPTLVWANTNAGELFPHVATPMTLAIADRVVRGLFGGLFHRLGVDLGDAPLLGLVGGRMYICVHTFAGLVARAPGMRGRSPAELFGGDGPAIERALAEVPPPGLSLRVRWWRALVGGPGLLLDMLRHHAVRPASAFAGIRARTTALTTIPRAPRACLAHVEAALDLAPWSPVLAAVSVGVGAHSVAARLCRAWLDDRDGAELNALLSGLGEVDSAEAGLALGELVEAARAPGVREALRSAVDAGAAVVRAADARAPEAPGGVAPAPPARAALAGDAGGAAFLAALDAWLDRHGHHARGELDVAVPRWREAPGEVLQVVLALLDAPGAADPRGLHARRAAARVAAEAALPARIGRLRAAVLRAALRRAQRGLAWREALKSEAVQRVALARKALLHPGETLVAEGRLDTPDDVFFVSLERLGAGLDGASDLRPAVRRARRAFAEHHLVTPPPVVVGTFDPRAAAAPPAPAEGDVLSGVAVSAGLVEGTARVVRAADTDVSVRPGEVLVAPFTDPGWAPHFVVAGALVVDMGGVLSHGSILARELGIPAVVNVRDATRRIRTGDRVRVDGYRGEVRILARG